LTIRPLSPGKYEQKKKENNQTKKLPKIGKIAPKKPQIEPSRTMIPIKTVSKTNAIVFLHVNMIPADEVDVEVPNNSYAKITKNVAIYYVW